jgi:predicted nucleotidyltransferase
MNLKDRQILEEFSEQVRHSFPNARIIAFGSRSRGDNIEESDFDICIVSDRINPEINDIIRNIAWEVGFEYERVITTVIFDEYQFELGPMSESTLVENIRREGIAA